MSNSFEFIVNSVKQICISPKVVQVSRAMLTLSKEHSTRFVNFLVFIKHIVFITHLVRKGITFASLLAQSLK